MLKILAVWSGIARNQGPNPNVNLKNYASITGAGPIWS